MGVITLAMFFNRPPWRSPGDATDPSRREASAVSRYGVGRGGLGSAGALRDTAGSGGGGWGVGGSPHVPWVNNGKTIGKP